MFRRKLSIVQHVSNNPEEVGSPHVSPSHVEEKNAKAHLNRRPFTQHFTLGMISWLRMLTKATVGGTPIFTGVFEQLARVARYPTDEDGLGTWFGAA